MTILFLMVGVPGSGKSTLIEKAFSEATVVCPDSKIGYTKENPWTRQTVKLAWNEARVELESAIKRGDKTIVFDATSISAKKRKYYVQLAKRYKIKIAAIYCSNVNLAKERNEAREQFRKVPKEVFDHMACSLVVPTKEEGFNFIIEYDGINLSRMIVEINEINKLV